MCAKAPAPGATLRERCVAALHTLAHVFHAGQVTAAVAELEVCCGLSSACAADCVAANGPAALVQHLRACGRDARNQATALAALAALGHVAACPALAGAVFAAQDAGVDCSSVVAAALQHHRESQGVLAAAVRLLSLLAADPGRAAALAGNAAATKQLAAAGQLLARRVDVEARYLARLEGTPPGYGLGFARRSWQCGSSENGVKADLSGISWQSVMLLLACQRPTETVWHLALHAQPPAASNPGQSVRL